MFCTVVVVNSLPPQVGISRHIICSKSTHRSGVIVNPHFGQVVFSEDITFSRTEIDQATAIDAL